VLQDARRYGLQPEGGLAFAWALRFFGDPEFRERRLNQEALLATAQNQHAIARLPTVIPDVFETECLAMVRHLFGGRLAAWGSKGIGGTKRAAHAVIPSDYWSVGAAPEVNIAHVRVRGEWWHDARITDPTGLLPLAVAAEAYGQDTDWHRRLAEWDARPLPYCYGPAMIDRAACGGYLIGSPRPSEDEKARLRADLIAKLRAGLLAAVGDDGGRAVQIGADEWEACEVDWTASAVGRFAGVRVVSHPRDAPAPGVSAVKAIKGAETRAKKWAEEMYKGSEDRDPWRPTWEEFEPEMERSHPEVSGAGIQRIWDGLGKTYPRSPGRPRKEKP
jgi:hypothetical protein